MASTAAAPRHLAYAEARERVLGAVRVLPSERVALAEARGRALQQPVKAPHALPPFRNSSMDGYAVRAEDLARATADRPIELQVVEVIPAGHVAQKKLDRNEAMRIMTGAEVPEGADAVVPFEDSTRLLSGDAERVRFGTPVSSGANVREAGADIVSGAEALPAGRELSPHDLALLAALGVARVEVGGRPKIAVFSTGDELLAVEDDLRPGAIRDSNLPMLGALLSEAGGLVERSENVADDPEAVARSVRRGLEDADVVITIGGISAGDFDPVKESLARLGSIELWRVAMKPGRPQAFGTPEGRLFFGLPGNPASVACVFEALVRPALRKMQGYGALDRPRVVARVAEPIESRAGRTDFVRVILEWRAEGWWATPAGVQVSGHLTPQARAHALLLVPEGASALAAGDRAEAWILRWPEVRPL